MYERGQPIDHHEEGGPAPAPGSPHFIIDEEGRKWYPFTVPHVAGFTIDYSLDPNPTAPAVDPAAPSNNPADYYVPQPRTQMELSVPSRLPSVSQNLARRGRGQRRPKRGPRGWPKGSLRHLLALVKPARCNAGRSLADPVFYIGSHGPTAEALGLLGGREAMAAEQGPCRPHRRASC